MNRPNAPPLADNAVAGVAPSYVTAELPLVGFPEVVQPAAASPPAEAPVVVCWPRRRTNVRGATFERRKALAAWRG